MAEPGAAIVAAQVLAFYKEPVRFRHRLTQGRETFAGGQHVFRFAQGRFPHALLRDLSAPERERLKEAAQFFVRQVCLWDGATHYQLLCLTPDARRDAIKDHYHGLMALIHPDRSEGTAEAWPVDAAQRANRAYAELSSDEARARYDAGLRRAAAEDYEDAEAEAEPSAVHAPPRGAFLARLRRPALLVTAAMAGLFCASVWWAAHVPREYDVLAAATPFDLSTRLMRDAMTSSERPRFLRSDEARAAQPAASAPAAEAPSVLSPLVKAFAPRREAAAEARETPPPAAAAQVPEARAPAPLEPARDLRASPQLTLGRAAAASPAPPRIVQAQAQAPTAPAAVSPGGMSTAAMESLMARLVTHYEAGDVDRLLALWDANSIGAWDGVRLRYEFDSFFRSTRSRRLRLSNVTWETSGAAARARGQAMLIAEYHDDTGRVERLIPVEIDAAMRDGQPRITRLNLYPHS